MGAMRTNTEFLSKINDRMIRIKRYFHCIQSIILAERKGCRKRRSDTQLKYLWMNENRNKKRTHHQQQNDYVAECVACSGSDRTTNK